MDTRTNFRHNPTYPCTPVLYQTPQIRLPSAALCACQGLVNIVPASQLIAGDHKDFQIVLSQNCSGTVVILCGWNVMVGSFIQTCGCKACQSAAKSVDLLPPVGNLKPPFFNEAVAVHAKLDRTPGINRLKLSSKLIGPMRSIVDNWRSFRPFCDVRWRRERSQFARLWNLILKIEISDHFVTLSQEVPSQIALIAFTIRIWHVVES